MKKKNKVAIIILLIVLLCIISVLFLKKDDSELRTVKSHAELSKIYEKDNTTIKDIFSSFAIHPYEYPLLLNLLFVRSLLFAFLFLSLFWL